MGLLRKSTLKKLKEIDKLSNDIGEITTKDYPKYKDYKNRQDMEYDKAYDQSNKKFGEYTYGDFGQNFGDVTNNGNYANLLYCHNPFNLDISTLEDFGLMYLFGDTWINRKPEEVQKFDQSDKELVENNNIIKNSKHIMKYNEYIKENKNNSIILSNDEEYGNYEGIIHYDMNKINNWFLKRKIVPEKYLQYIEIPIAFLNNINVFEEYRNKQYGNKLYNSFENECYENDVKCIILESDSYENQLEGFDLDKWYENLGYEIIGNESGNSIMIKIL